MTRVLLAYGSEEGQTAKISERIADGLRRQGIDVDLMNCRTVSRDFVLQGYDAAMIGASIHMGRHQRYVADFVQLFREELGSLPSAFFTVCLTAKSDAAEDREQVANYMREFEGETGWHADRVAVFAGALPYTQYGMVKRFFMQRINRDAGGDADTSRDYDYTDWASVDEFAQEFLELVAATGQSRAVRSMRADA